MISLEHVLAKLIMVPATRMDANVVKHLREPWSDVASSIGEDGTHSGIDRNQSPFEDEPDSDATVGSEGSSNTTRIGSFKTVDGSSRRYEDQTVATADDLTAGAGSVWGDGSTAKSDSVQQETSRPNSPALAVSPALAKLYGEIGQDSQIHDRFVQDYLTLLDDRVATIHRHLQARHDEQARISLLSLETASVMVGAAQLAELAIEVRGWVDRQERNVAAELFVDLEVEAANVKQQLRGPSRPDGQPKSA